MGSQTIETIAFPLWIDRRQKVDNSLTGKYLHSSATERL